MIVMTGAIFISDNLVFVVVEFDVNTAHNQLYTPCVIHNHQVIYHPKKASIFSLWNNNMDGLPKWDGRVISSTGSTTARECGKVGRGDRRWCLSVRRVSQVGPSSPFLLCLLRNPSPLDKLTSYLGEIWPGGGADKRGGKFHLIATYGKEQKRQWKNYISKVLFKVHFKLRSDFQHYH